MMQRESPLLALLLNVTIKDDAMWKALCVHLGVG